MQDGLNGITATDLDRNPVVPNCSMLIRLLPKSQAPIPAPSYESGYYRSDTCKPTASEKRIFASFSDTMAKTERDIIIRLMQVEKTPSVNLSQHEAWLLNKLDIKKQQGVTQPAGNLDIGRSVRYRPNLGLKVHFQNASGMPDDLYIQCFAYISPGKQAKYMGPTEEGYGKEEKLLTTNLDPTCLINAPSWGDPPQDMHPIYDQHSCLLIQLIGLKMVYKYQKDHKKAGIVEKADGVPLAIANEEIIGWTVLPLFEGNSVQSGLHHLPVLTLPMNDEIIEELSQDSAQSVLSRKIWNDGIRMKNASLSVMIWDSHYDPEELPEKKTHSKLLDITNVRISSTPQSGLTQQEWLLAMLDDKAKKQGLKGSIFKKEQTFFNNVIKENFLSLMDDFCLKNGFAPL